MNSSNLSKLYCQLIRGCLNTATSAPYTHISSAFHSALLPDPQKKICRWDCQKVVRTGHGNGGYLPIAKYAIATIFFAFE